MQIILGLNIYKSDFKKAYNSSVIIKKTSKKFSFFIKKWLKLIIINIQLLYQELILFYKISTILSISILFSELSCQHDLIKLLKI